jgi:hypothetical protein
VLARTPLRQALDKRQRSVLVVLVGFSVGRGARPCPLAFGAGARLRRPRTLTRTM